VTELATETAALQKRYEPSFLVGLYRKMAEIREVEEALIRLFAEGRMPGFIHSYIGEEATGVGVCAALRSDDYITSTHRGHGHILAKGGDLRRFMAEVFGRSTGYCGGKGGSMHIADFEIGILGANGVVGGGIPIAAGAACSSLLAGQDRVAVAFFGDGAADIGSFHESLNLAAIWRLPVVFVCENNGYADFISTHDHMLIEHVSERASAYGIPGVTVDGNDVTAVYEATRDAVHRARSGDGPTLLEAVTYRWRGHYEGDPQPYRTDEEVEGWRERDPIKRLREQLLDLGIMTETDVQTIRAEIRAAVEQAVEFAEGSATPEPSAALTDVYTDLVEEGW
jgi:pyruvate dehydrogenase E1 component alpha subunit